MSVSLSKGQRVDLTKGRPSLKNILVGLGWDINHYVISMELMQSRRIV